MCIWAAVGASGTVAAEQPVEDRNLLSPMGTAQLSKWHMVHLLLFSKAASGLPVPSSNHSIITSTCSERKLSKCCSNTLYNRQGPGFCF